MAETLAKRDLAELMKLLGYLQDYLESDIDCHRQPGSKMPSDPADAKIIRTAMAKWKRAEKMVKKLEEMR